QQNLIRERVRTRDEQHNSTASTLRTYISVSTVALSLLPRGHGLWLDLASVVARTARRPHDRRFKRGTAAHPARRVASRRRRFQGAHHRRERRRQGRRRALRARELLTRAAALRG